MKKNISFLSVGNHFKKNILPVLNSNPEINVKGIFTRNHKNRRSLCSELGCHEYSSYEDLLLDKDCQNVYISSPNASHFNQIVDCLKNNKNVLVEKPAITDVDQYKKIESIAHKNNVFFMEAFMYRFHNQFSELQTIINQGDFGSTKFAQFDFGFPHLNDNNFRYSKELKGGALFDAGAYTLSCPKELFSVKPKLIGAKIFQESGFNVDTGGSALLDFESFTSQSNWFFGATYQNSAKVWFNDAFIIADMFFSKPANSKSNIKIFRNYELIDEIDIKDNNHFESMFKYFLNNTPSQQAEEMLRVKNNIELIQQVSSFEK